MPAGMISRGKGAHRPDARDFYGGKIKSRDAMLRRTAFVLGGATVYGSAALASYIYFSDVDKSSLHPVHHNERISIYDKNAATYDKGEKLGGSYKIGG